MTLIVNKPFMLVTAEGEKKNFAVGEKIAGALADHWYVKAHCTADAEPKAEPQAEESKEPTARRGRPPKGN